MSGRVGERVVAESGGKVQGEQVSGVIGRGGERAGGEGK